MIFMSYAREDADKTNLLAESLAAHGIAVSMDATLPQSAPFWREQVAAMLASCRALIAVDSPFAAASPWVEEERRAFDGPSFTVTLDSSLSVQSATPGVCNWPELMAWLDAVPQRQAASKEAANAGATVSRPRRAALLWKQQEWLAACRERYASRAAELCRDGPDYINVTDGSRLRPVSADAGVLLATMPVSNRQYAKFVEDSGACEPATWSRQAYRLVDSPVTGVTWFEASAYAAWAGAALPSEAEWIRAARAGQTQAIYATMSGGIGPGQAVFAQAFGATVPEPVTQCAPNPAGFFGMCGNTWDWVDCAWRSHRVIKGGGCMDAERFCRIDARYRNAPIDRDCCVGFRIKAMRSPVSS